MMMAGRPGEINARRASRILGVHVKTVRRWVYEGRLRARKDINNRVWIKKVDVVEIANRNQDVF